MDEHNDLSGTFTAAGTALASSTTWDPWGQVLASTGPAIQVGYQGQWTDPVTQQVNMGARMYSAGANSAGPRFIDKDTSTAGAGGASVTDDAYAYVDDNPVTLTDVSGHAPSSKAGSGGGISEGQVSAAYARAAAAGRKAAEAGVEAGLLKAKAEGLSALAWAAKELADVMNSAAKRAEEVAAAAAQLAAKAFADAQAAMAQAKYWQQQADAEWAAAKQYAKDALTWEAWKIPGYLKDAAEATVRAGLDELKAAYYLGRYLFYEGVGHAEDLIADAARSLAAHLSSLARGDANEAARLSGEAAADNREASCSCGLMRPLSCRRRGTYTDDANRLAG